MKVKKIILPLLLFLFILSLAFAKPLTVRLSEFLTKSERVNANILVVEGWLPYDDLSAALNEFRSGNYDYIIKLALKQPLSTIMFLPTDSSSFTLINSLPLVRVSRVFQ